MPSLKRKTKAAFLKGWEYNENSTDGTYGFLVENISIQEKLARWLEIGNQYNGRKNKDIFLRHLAQTPQLGQLALSLASNNKEAQIGLENYVARSDELFRKSALHCAEIDTVIDVGPGWGPNLVLAALTKKRRYYFYEPIASTAEIIKYTAQKVSEVFATQITEIDNFKSVRNIEGIKLFVCSNVLSEISEKNILEIVTFLSTTMSDDDILHITDWFRPARRSFLINQISNNFRIINNPLLSGDQNCFLMLKNGSKNTLIEKLKLKIAISRMGCIRLTKRLHNRAKILKSLLIKSKR